MLGSILLHHTHFNFPKFIFSVARTTELLFFQWRTHAINTTMLILTANLDFIYDFLWLKPKLKLAAKNNSVCNANWIFNGDRRKESITCEEMSKTLRWKQLIAVIRPTLDFYFLSTPNHHKIWKCILCEESK